eukprot:TRINITY_DN6990_c0_g1_i2.p1 TRINITY_DN6990_c0_g1~~TRINITY_DN6990_c0_g1_i2.p1  ORF type:complete len:401 (+),score=90.11 TRINITY_DN6990_c0_g1_i2:28-1230(+)
MKRKFEESSTSVDLRANPVPKRQRSNGSYNKVNQSDDGTREWEGPSIKIKDAAAKQEEDQGILHFTTIYNDGTKKNLKLLMELKTIISNQLPEMPSDYITQLVFDDRHKSLIGIKQERVIGGITFKCFEKKGYTKFIEVVFCAITTKQQVRGYGSRLMNHLKNWSKKNEFYHLLTYADNNAIGYFSKQGFSSDIGLEPREWNIGFLKDYEKAELMHCYIDPRVDNLGISNVLHLQRKAFISKLRELSNQHIIYPGLQHFKEGGTGRVDLEDVKGLKESGWEADEYKKSILSKENQSQVKQLNKKLLDSIINDEEDLTWPFKIPVEEMYPDEADSYREKVQDPIDLRTIQEKLKNGFYITHEMLVADLQRMVDNCKAYNEEDSVYWKIAEKIDKTYLKKKK